MKEDKDEFQGYKRKEYEKREDLTGEHRFSDIGQLILLISFVIIWIIGIIDFQVEF